MNVEAEAAYAKLITLQDGNFAEDYYNYAMVLKMNGKGDQATVWVDKFFELKPDDLRAKDDQVNRSELFNLSKDDGKFKINPMGMNSNADDFGTSYFRNKVVFSSSRTASKKNYNWNRKSFLDLYIADVNESQLKDADVFDKSINGKLHNGPASFSNDGNCMAFTKNNSNGGKENVIRLEINFSTFKDGEWSKPESFSLNSLQYSVGHPSLSADGNTMYFASDMPGGFGGVDIYKVTKSSGGTWGKAVNLGPKINTEGDELFPFFEEKSGVLFFSSNGHFGLGGLDIFYCYIEGSMVGRIRNAGYPVNTQYDDFAGIVNDKLSSGYFSSNRSGGHGGDDIYGVDLLKPLDYGKKIQGVVKDDNGNALPEVFVKLSDDKDSVIETLTANTDGTFFFLVDSNKSFKLNGKKETYTEGNNIANTFGKEFIVIADLTLLKKEEVVIQVIPDLTKAPSGTDLTKVSSLKNIYFDYDKYNIRRDAEVELAKIILVLNQYPNMVVELEANTDCRGTIAYNQILSDKRANSSIKYIQQRITNPSRITGKGYGKSKLINGCECDGVVASECSENEHQLNRRTEFIIVDESITSAK